VNVYCCARQVLAANSKPKQHTIMSAEILFIEESFRIDITDLRA
jgi:hypothetical protein